MERREFIAGAFAAAACAASGAARKAGDGAATAGDADGGRILFGACRGARKEVELMKSVGYDFWEGDVPRDLDPSRDDEWWKKRRDAIASYPLPLRSCTGFIPGRFRLTGPAADHEAALEWAEKALRRAEEAGVKTVVFGSGGARNVPGDYCSKERKAWPDVEKGARQYEEFCRKVAERCADLKTVQVVIEPLRPNESNIVNYVWQGERIARSVGSPRVKLLADLFHMMMGGESPESIVRAKDLVKHCHIAEYSSRKYPGCDAENTARLAPYMAALKSIGYTGGVSCECGFGKKEDFAKNLETALKTMKGMT